jgi:hypothetical protein
MAKSERHRAKQAKKKAQRAARDQSRSPGLIHVPGEHARTIEMTPEMEATVIQQLARFREKFGREPGPDDPLFFDPDLDVPTPLTAPKIENAVVESMIAVGIHPKFIYAYQQAGVLITEDNIDMVDDAAIQDWTDAVERYEALHAA